MRGISFKCKYCGNAMGMEQVFCRTDIILVFVGKCQYCMVAVKWEITIGELLLLSRGGNGKGGKKNMGGN